MKLLRWWKRRRNGANDERQRWRTAWNAAIDGNDPTALGHLKAELSALNTRNEDVEVELEMLDALERLAEVRNGSLPVVETQHRVVAGNTCHFSAPASLPADDTQASGRVLFTGSKGIFISGARTRLVPWYAIRDVIRSDRDLLLVRGDGSAAAHFRFNTYADAVVAAHLARRLKASKGTRVL